MTIPPIVTGIITRKLEDRAVVWDGTDAAWEAIEALPHDNCAPRRGGVCTWGTFHPFPIGHVVSTYEDGCLYSRPRDDRFTADPL